MSTQFIIATPAGSKKLKALKAFLEALDIDFEIKQDVSSTQQEYTLTKEQLDILEERKERHIKKKSRSHRWEDIKNELKSSSDEDV